MGILEVIAIIGLKHFLQPSSTSPTTGILLLIAYFTNSLLILMPGLMQISDTSLNNSSLFFISCVLYISTIKPSFSTWNPKTCV